MASSSSPNIHIHRCKKCSRTYRTRKALQQHSEDSPVHGFKCGWCVREFGNQSALHQHLRSAHIFECQTCNQFFESRVTLDQHMNSPLHVFRCDRCNRTFRSQSALEQHTNSPAHVFSCTECDQSFASRGVLEHHLRSPPHIFPCERCDQSFDSQSALELHLNSPAHRPECIECSRSFKTQSALEQHLNSPAHVSSPPGPLDRFFTSYPTFDYDPSLPPATSYKLLRRHQRWQRNDLAGEEGWSQYQDALTEEFEKWFGSEDDLEAWHALCRAIRIDPLPATKEACKMAVRNRHVNMIDLIEWGRNGDGEDNNTRVEVFATVQELSEYCRETEKIYRNNLDGSEQGGVVLRHLLRRIFR